MIHHWMQPAIPRPAPFRNTGGLLGLPQPLERRNTLAKITFPVEASHIMMFARAIGATNPVYQDAEAAKNTELGGIIAPPTFPQAVAQFDPDYHLRWRPNQPWFGSGKTQSGVEGKPTSS